MPKAVERWLCEKCGTLHETQEKAKRCEARHKELLNVEFVYKTFDRFPSKVFFTFCDEESGITWRVPGEIEIDGEGEDWERVK